MMKVSRILVLGGLSASLVSACGGPEDLGAETSALTQTLRVKALSDGHEIAGSRAELERSRSRIGIEVSTRELNPGEAVDVLTVVFNNSDACVNGNPVTGSPCGPPDLFVAGTEASLHYVATLTADAQGRLAYDTRLDVGNLSSCVGGSFPCNGLTNPRRAEIHSAMFAPNGGPGRQAAQFLPPN
jgi:hypothetical protein